MSSTRTLPLLLMTAAFAALSAVIYLLIQNSAPPDPAFGKPAPTGPEADISMTSVYQTFTRKGRIERTLAADTAYLVEQKNRAVFEGIKLTFLASDGTPSVVTAKHGVLSTDTGNAELSGGVVIENQAHKIYARTLHYNDNRHILYSTEPVVVTGDSLHFTGDSMTFDMTTGRAELSGNVIGSITDNTLAIQ